MKILIAIVVTLFVFGIPLVVAQTETIEHLRRQMESMSACKKSLSDPKCNLDILKPDIRAVLIQLDDLKSASKEYRLENHSTTSYSGFKSRYAIEVSYNDELFIINGEKFEAKTYLEERQVRWHG
jgi:hypothetical protein|tara:strand:- start:816 stop:1190 length:375 start_codon:yes stop_codon:yes gene_type:complete